MSTNLVLDLDECLVHTFTDPDWEVYNEIMTNPDHFDLRHRVFKIDLGDVEFWAIKRPHLNQFLKYCFRTFDNVCVWSAGTKQYVKAVVKVIFRDFKKPALVMTRNDVFHYSDRDYTKPLAFFYAKMPGANEHNTVIIDDKEDNFIYNRANGLHIAAYEPDDIIEDLRREDTALVEFMLFFSRLFVMTAVTTYPLVEGIAVPS